MTEPLTYGGWLSTLCHHAPFPPCDCCHYWFHVGYIQPASGPVDPIDRELARVRLHRN